MMSDEEIQDHVLDILGYPSSNGLDYDEPLNADLFTHRDEYGDQSSGMMDDDEDMGQDEDIRQDEDIIQDEDSDFGETKSEDIMRENNAVLIYRETLPDREQVALGGREIAENDAIWSVSSFRPHWGPDKLRDNNALTYWQ
ncbi:MAG: hypothetical protein EXX96DRAFT_576004 [Benjaminiella poitrasii]|nr:MAG: hypothetical protein EXX96DRAFT_576004 [Benjaminiella poitrasii]